MLNKILIGEIHSVHMGLSRAYRRSGRKGFIAIIEMSRSHMTRNEKVYRTLEELCNEVSYDQIQNGFEGFTTEEICQKSGFARPNVSKELNLLCKKNEAVKIHGRPVHYFSVKRLSELFSVMVTDQMELSSLQELCTRQSTSALERVEQMDHKDPFWGIQQMRPSLANVIKQCKAAIIYPPNGLYTLLIGPSGVGKTFIAEIMYLYAKENGLLKESGKFVSFNCAEYADNPQLLLSQLFGYVKGAFTGATTEKQGVIDHASGGILLLDEIHRLPPQGQEMLFTLIDKGYFRRLGDSEHPVRVNLRLICATTENPKSNMLTTFLRRIPMIINIPPLEDASLSERYSIVKSFFENEANALGLPIKISRRVLISILLYLPKGNLGQLRSDIQRLCARAYLEHKLKDEAQPIEIATDFLQGDMVNGLLKYNECREEISRVPFLNRQQWFTFYGSNFRPLPAERADHSKMYVQIEQLYEKYKEKEVNNIHIERSIQQYIQDYMDQLIEESGLHFDEEDSRELSDLVGERIYSAMRNALAQSAKILSWEYRSEMVVALALHIAMLVKCLMKEPPRVESISDGDIKEVAERFPVEYSAGQVFRQSLERDLNISIPESEDSVFAVFFFNGKKQQEEEESAVPILLLAHGSSTASSICDVVNRITKANLCYAIDMDLNEPSEHCLERAVKLVEKIHTNVGVLLIVDMGSLMTFGNIIAERTGVPVRSIDSLSTQVALEAAQKCQAPHADVDWVYESLMKTRASKQRRGTGEQQSVMTNEKRLIAVTCLGGLEAAKKLSCEIASGFGPEIDGYLECLPCGINGSEVAELGDRIVVVAGEIDLDLPGVPYLSLNSFQPSEGMERLFDFLESDFSIKLRGGKFATSRNTYMGGIARILEEYLNILNPVKVLEIVAHSFEVLKKDFFWVNPATVRLNYILHCSCMIERILSHQALCYDHLEERLSKSPEQVKLLRAALRGIEEIYCIKVPDTELAYLLDLIDTY